ncbi:MAG: winged helix-turn-helix domain-containing protein [Gemmatimonadales bacterium]
MLVKPVDTDELVARIRAIARRPRRPAGELFRLGPLTVDCERRVAELAGEPIDVTATEFQLLRELMRRPDQPVVREALIDLLWPGQRVDAGASASLSVHVSNLREKLAAAGAPVTIRARRRVGYQIELRSASSGGDW